MFKKREKIFLSIITLYLIYKNPPKDKDYLKVYFLDKDGIR